MTDPRDPTRPRDEPAAGGSGARRPPDETLASPGRRIDATADVPPPGAGPAAGASIGGAAGSAAVGRSIGPYRILGVLGEGGFGVVYLAERREPHVQRVALKVIKPGMDSASVINRFAAERQALAVMDHPSIARVFDGGSTSDGRPYFVMEYVKGDAITTFCDRERLGIEERLELFITVCEAVQHAHGKGVIHRDLKPSNVLVEFEDGRATPKIIDFGVAKALNQRLTEGTVYTEIGQFIGTPEYMSPEQAEMTGVDIDTRADVYSLGVMLYEIVTGRLPFDAQKLREGGYAGIQKTIREVEPPKPSQRFTTIVQAGSQEAKAVAQARRVDPPTLSRRLKGDLDWVVMRCLEKDRARRYQTANDLALELRRVLDDEPVLAGPPSLGYRASKFIRRHRASVLAATVVVLALVTATAVSILFAIREAAAREVAQQERDRAQEAERLAAEEAERARIAAATSQRISAFTTGILEGVDPTKAGDLDKTLMRQILDDASRRIERELAEDPVVQAALRDVIGGTYLALGEFDDAGPQLEQALAARRSALGDEHRTTLLTREKIAELTRKRGQIAEAAAQQREILAARRRVLGDDDPDTIGSLANLALVLRLLGDLDGAEPLLVECLERSRKSFGDRAPSTLKAMNNMAAMHRSRNRTQDAEALLRDALAGQREVLGVDHPETLGSMQNLAGLLRQRSSFDEAEALLVEVVAMREKVQGAEHPDSLLARNSLGAVLLAKGDAAAAVSAFEASLAGLRGRFPPDNPQVLAVVQNLSTALARTDRAAEAESILRAMIDDAAARGIASIESLRLEQLLAQSLEQQARYEDAERVLARLVLTARRRLPSGDAALAVHLAAHGASQRRLGRFAAAETTLLEAQQILEAARGAVDPQTRQVHAALAKLYEDWHAAEPGKGHDASAADWRSRGGG